MMHRLDQDPRTTFCSTKQAFMCGHTLAWCPLCQSSRRQVPWPFQLCAAGEGCFKSHQKVLSPHKQFSDVLSFCECFHTAYQCLLNQCHLRNLDTLESCLPIKKDTHTSPVLLTIAWFFLAADLQGFRFLICEKGVGKVED